MTSITERIRLNRIFVDDWSINEKLVLASAVQKSGDQNWVSVMKMIINHFKDESLIETKRPSDWFTPKACAIQYQLLLETYAKDLPKRKKRDKNSAEVTETPVDFIVKQLWTLRIAEVEKNRARVLKEHEETKQLVKQIVAGNLNQDQIDEQYELIENYLLNKEKKIIIEYEEMIRKREERRKLIQEKGPFVSNVNTNLYKSTFDNEEKSSSPTSPLLTSLLQSPSRSSTPTMSNLLTTPTMTTPTMSTPTLSKLLETPPSSLLQKELSKQTPQAQNQPQVVPPSTPSPNSMSGLDDIKATLPDVITGALDKNEEVEDFAEKWFDPDFLNMNKEELEGTLNAKALFEVLGGSEEVGLPHVRADSVEEDSVQEEEVITLDHLNEPLVEEVVLEDHIIQSVEEVIDEEDIQQQQEQQKQKQHEKIIEIKNELIDCNNKGTTLYEHKEHIKQSNDKINKDDIKTTTQTATIIKEIKQLEKNINESDSNKTKEIKIEQTKETEIKNIVNSIVKGTLEKHLPEKQDDTNKTSSNLSSNENIATSSSTPGTTTTSNTPNKEIRNSRLSKDNNSEFLTDNKNDNVAIETTTPTTINKERRKSIKSNIILEDNKFNKDINTKKINETRSSKTYLDKNQQQQQDNSKESRILRSNDTSPSPINKDIKKNEINTTIKETRLNRYSKDYDTNKDVQKDGNNTTSTMLTTTPVILNRSPRNSKEFDKEIKNIGNKNEKEQQIINKKENIISKDKIKDVKKNLDKYTKDTGSNLSGSGQGGVTTPTSSDKRKLRSESEVETSSRNIITSSDDSNDSDDILDETNISGKKNLDDISGSDGNGQSGGIGGEGDEFKTPPVLNSGRKRNSIKINEGRSSSPFSTGSDKSDKDKIALDSRAKKTLMAVYQNIISNKHSSIFMKPILDSQAKDYSKIVKVPANLTSIKKKIESGAIRTVPQFQRTILLLFTNAMMYNPVGSPLYDVAREMMADCNKELQMLVQAVNEGGVLTEITLTEDVMPLVDRHKRLSLRTESPGPLKKKGKKSEEDEEEIEVKKTMKRPLAPSPKTVLTKKRRTK